ncbi:MAG: hypothetical protein IJR00_05155 [Lachnospiraceae bacterium]|nr:hypothetical protein [Lachnospiraceae bacterium]
MKKQIGKIRPAKRQEADVQRHQVPRARRNRKANIAGSVAQSVSEEKDTNILTHLVDDALTSVENVGCIFVDGIEAACVSLLGGEGCADEYEIF